MANQYLSVLFIGAVWPEPKSSAGGSRLMQLLNLFLQQNYSVTFASSSSHSEFSEDLASLGIKSKEIELNNSSFDVFVKELKPNIVVFDRFITEEQFSWRVAEASPESIRILETIDLHCLRLARQESLKSNKNLNSLLLQSETAKREIASIYRSDLTLIISSFEIDLLTNVFKVPKNLLFHLPYKVHAKQYNNTPSFSHRNDFITIGNFKHEPNWDSVKYLKKNIWPLIKKQIPSAKLHVYGSYITPKVQQLHNEKEGFYIMGRAEDASLVMQKAKVCLAPLRFGAGIKGKLADAMVSGTPSVTTVIGAEGMFDNLTWCGAIEDDELNFVNAAVALYTNEVAWTNAQKRGFELAEKMFCSVNDEQNIMHIISSIFDNITQHRKQNFTGLMLFHHTLQSTKYLSKWIEEKNK